MTFLRKLFLQNLPLKILSVVLAFLLWGFVVGEKDSEVGVTVPLELVNVPADTAITNDIPADVSLRFKGPRNLVRNLSERGMIKTIDLKDMKPGVNTINLLPESFPVPRGLELIRVSPSSLIIYLERIITKRLRVMASLEGEPADNFAVTKVVVKPDSIIVSGSKSELSATDFLWTAPIDINDIQKNLDITTPLEKYSRLLKVLESDAIHVQVIVEPKIDLHTFRDVPVVVKGPEYTYRVQPDKVTLTATGTVDQIKSALKGSPPQVTLDLSDKPPGRYMLEYGVSLPHGLSLKKTSPERLKTDIYKRRVKSKRK
ncbi:MAG: hypothetical protein HQK58_04535 [Deltaproteobacteria bacterium]|nr:hypothetical protein [Deltaproteobacteria bacterium]